MEKVALKVPGLVLSAGTNYSIFAIGLSQDDTLDIAIMIDATPTSSTNDTTKTAQVRLMHLSPDAAGLDVRIDGKLVWEDVEFPLSAGDLHLNQGEHRIQITSAGATTPILVDEKITFEARKAYTLAVTGLFGADDLQLIVLMDDRTSNPNMAKVRFVHASPDTYTVDVMLSNQDILFPNIAFRHTGDYLEVAPGTYELVLRTAKTKGTP